MSAYKGFTEAQAKAHKKYMQGKATIQIRTDTETRERINAHASFMGESTNEFINRAILETMVRDAIAARAADQVQAGTLGAMEDNGSGRVGPVSKF